MTLGKSVAALVVLFSILCPPFLLGDSILATNSDFETGNFTGWLTAGDTFVVNSSFGIASPGGNYQALMSTAPDQCCAEVPNPGYPFQANGTLSGTPSLSALFCNAVSTPPPGNPLVFPSPLESFLGLQPCTFPRGLLITPWEGSAIEQSFTGNAGDVLSFNFDYLTNESTNGFVGGLGSDYPFAVIDGTLNFLIPVNREEACTSYPRPPGPGAGSPFSPTGFTTDCGYQLFTTTLTTSGTHTVGIGVVDTEVDPGVNSAILVDNVSLTAIPEPGTWLSLATGLVVIGLSKRKRATRTTVASRIFSSPQL